MLEDHTDFRPEIAQLTTSQDSAAVVLRFIAGDPAVHDQSTAIRHLHQIDTAKERALARAGGTDNRNDFAPVDGQIYAFKDFVCAK